METQARTRTEELDTGISLAESVNEKLGGEGEGKFGLGLGKQKVEK